MTKPANKKYSPPTTHTSNPHAATQRADLDALLEKVRDKVLENPEKAAILLRDWIHSPEKSGAKNNPTATPSIRKKAA